MIALDTSVVIAAFASWHEAHVEAAAVFGEEPMLPAPAALEAYAVLTRMPPPHRVEAQLVQQFLERSFSGRQLFLPKHRARHTIDDLTRLGIVGGAAYDAVIALTAAHHDCELATLDHRARVTYERVGVAVRYLG